MDIRCDSQSFVMWINANVEQSTELVYSASCLINFAYGSQETDV